MSLAIEMTEEKALPPQRQAYKLKFSKRKVNKSSFILTVKFETLPLAQSEAQLNHPFNKGS